MSRNYMITIVKKENDKPYIVTIPKRAKSIIKIIGNDYEMIEYETVLLVYNKDQDDENLKENKLFKDIKFKGNIMIVGNIKKRGDIRSLNKRELHRYCKMLNIKSYEEEREI